MPGQVVVEGVKEVKLAFQATWNVQKHAKMAGLPHLKLKKH
jgi:hypothetical protein